MLIVDEVLCDIFLASCSHRLHFLPTRRTAEFYPHSPPYTFVLKTNTENQYCALTASVYSSRGRFSAVISEHTSRLLSLIFHFYSLDASPY